MVMLWSPETASKAFIDTVKSCENIEESSVAELLSAMAAGWKAKLIVEAWCRGSDMAVSVGLAVAARHVCGRHVCIVRDEESMTEYVTAMQELGSPAPELVVGEAEAAMAGLVGVEFLVVDSRSEEFSRMLRAAKLSNNGAVLTCMNVTGGGFKWSEVLDRGTRVVKSVFSPVGKGLDVAHIGGSCGGAKMRSGRNRWIRVIDHESGEEHVFRSRGVMS